MTLALLITDIKGFDCLVLDKVEALAPPVGLDDLEPEAVPPLIMLAWEFWLARNDMYLQRESQADAGEMG